MDAYQKGIFGEIYNVENSCPDYFGFKFGVHLEQSVYFILLLCAHSRQVV